MVSWPHIYYILRLGSSSDHYLLSFAVNLSLIIVLRMNVLLPANHTRFPSIHLEQVWRRKSLKRPRGLTWGELVYCERHASIRNAPHCSPFGSHVTLITYKALSTHMQFGSVLNFQYVVLVERPWSHYYCILCFSVCETPLLHRIFFVSIWLP